MPDEPAPQQRLGDPARVPLYELNVPHPVRSVLANGWPVILVVLVLVYVFAVFFPALGGLLLIAAPLAVFAAFAAATFRARSIRLTVTDEMIRVSNGRAGNACDRSHVQTAVLVESLSRRRIGPRTADLILLDRDGRAALVLSGMLWPPAILDQIIELIQPVPVERVGGRQTPLSLTARYPKILQNTDGSHKDQRGR